MKESYDNNNWAKRLGCMFNGIHLLCGFQSNASTGENNMLNNFANNKYNNKNTILEAWLNLAKDDQPNGTDVVVMGPIIRDTDTIKYNSIKSKLSNNYYAFWNDKTWGISNGPGEKIHKEDIKGYWRVVMEL